MKFKVLRKSYIHDTLYEVGAIVEIDEAELAKDKKGNVDLSKHTGLKPLGKVKAAPAPVEDDEDDETEDDDGPDAELSDAEKAQAITDALDTLNAEDDAHWTKKGLPDVNVVQEILGFDVTRAAIESVAPDFIRPQSE